MYIAVIALLVASLLFVSLKWNQERKLRRRLQDVGLPPSLPQRNQAAPILADEFVSVLSHELRTPLTPILGAAYMLRAEPENPRIFARSVDLIERNAQALSKMIEDLLDATRILSGKLHLSMETVELESVIHAAMAAVYPAAEAKRIRIETELHSLSGVVWGDNARLQQVLANLLANSVKFTPKGGTITVQLRQTGSFAELRVVDTGIGIPADCLPNIFEGGPTRSVAGLGFGLPVVRRLVESHGGAVSAQSSGAEQGATFLVRLPLRPASQNVLKAHAGH